jgi:hypothetical protein
MHNECIYMHELIVAENKGTFLLVQIAAPPMCIM